MFKHNQKVRFNWGGNESEKVLEGTGAPIKWEGEDEEEEKSERIRVLEEVEREVQKLAGLNNTLHTHNSNDCNPCIKTDVFSAVLSRIQQLKDKK